MSVCRCSQFSVCLQSRSPRPEGKRATKTYSSFSWSRTDNNRVILVQNTSFTNYFTKYFWKLFLWFLTISFLQTFISSIIKPHVSRPLPNQKHSSTQTNFSELFGSFILMTKGRCLPSQQTDFSCHCPSLFTSSQNPLRPKILHKLFRLFIIMTWARSLQSFVNCFVLANLFHLKPRHPPSTTHPPKSSTLLQSYVPSFSRQKKRFYRVYNQRTNFLPYYKPILSVLFINNVQCSP